ncbi:hypothetical protein HRW16_24770 [Streptomyces lunaelactis]|uniref:hypothetical protein n=1 Tax=Streptomyces lunaelactis TaxID=1535768 RepID=UPI001585ACBD|nr:hypothetical protein [Streptomyces lunaelactis]NUK00296.1 hypothetical protein [Streptomyces lunaelactis]NUK18787.1 hypothetical protein [Streptomyces lunaelactis]NUK37611.1 hypothetical protein [Streptomyces lunaelactis]NUK45478.1 hypothetical protein [Streptomyces lunaelactis]NUK94986.1 hypothetical protein [Streptomyces lunaelactis]
MEITATHVGTATVLLRIGELTVLTDPVLDPAGSEYVVDIPARGMSVPLWRTAGPAITAEELPPIDLVLLSHDEHADNLDHTGRALHRQHSDHHEIRVRPARRERDRAGAVGEPRRRVRQDAHQGHRDPGPARP